MSDSDLVTLGTREIDKLGLVKRELVVDGTVVRMPKAYPIYDRGYGEAVKVVRDWLAQFSNLQLVGRNGMHRYNNQDHSMLTAMMAALNIVGSHYDLWQVNVDEEYHEEGKSITLEDLRAVEQTQPLVPSRIEH